MDNQNTDRAEILQISERRKTQLRQDGIDYEKFDGLARKVFSEFGKGDFTLAEAKCWLDLMGCAVERICMHSPGKKISDITPDCWQ